MSSNLENLIKDICQKVSNDRARLMDVVISVAKQEGSVSNEAINLIAQNLGISRVEVEGVVSFYAFLSKENKGKVIIRLCNDVVDNMKGAADIAKAVKEALKISFGQTTADGIFTLEHTPCIGMCDQAPAALINDVVVTNLTAAKIKDIISALKQNSNPASITKSYGDGNNSHELVKSSVNNNIRKKGEVIFAEHENESGLKKALALKPEEVIAEIKTSKLRGRGGAGFPTGMKWDFTRIAKGDQKYILCNADEGEPGTFKDRVILTERFDMLIEGMTVAGYAIGSNSGIIYLRGEYAYLRNFLEKKLEDRRKNKFLGKNILGKDGFNFDVRIQSGAGAYICGEESALISSCEGLRGDPKTRPPFPAQKGYMSSPTAVNNVETYCCAARIMEMGAKWFVDMGTPGSPGTKLLSISGDCQNPGVYEYPFGVKVEQVLKDAGADNVKAVLVGGPSGQIIGVKDFNRIICYDDLATGGSFVIFNQSRNILEVALEYMEFFVEESCGYCTPCRVGNVLIRNKLKDIINGRGESADLTYLKELGQSIKFTSRCGLGQTSPNPVLTTMKNFPQEYEKVVAKDSGGVQLNFDVNEALKDAENIMGRKSEIF